LENFSSGADKKEKLKVSKVKKNKMYLKKNIDFEIC